MFPSFLTFRCSNRKSQKLVPSIPYQSSQMAKNCSRKIRKVANPQNKLPQIFHVTRYLIKPLCNDSILVPPYLRTFQASSTGTVNRWKEEAPGHVRGSITFRRHQGALVIGRSGTYYVYSQMYYYDCTSYFMSHYTLRNEETILGSVSSVVDCNRAYSTNHQGGVFHLDRGDVIKVEVYKSKTYNMRAPYSYFGVYMLYPDLL